MIFFLPGPYLGVGCALGYSDMGQLTLLGYGVAASCLSVLIYALLSFRAGVCSMARQIKDFSVRIEACEQMGVRLNPGNLCVHGDIAA